MENSDVFQYHIKVCEHFKKNRKIWDYFAATNVKLDQWAAYKTHLLKNTYKFDPAEHPEIYEKTTKAAQILGLDHVHVNVYQENNSSESNASVAFEGAEVHIVFRGRLLSLLKDDELLAILAHELSHVRFYRLHGGDFEVADRIVIAIGNHNNSEDAHFETARRFNLYKEMFCDRGALQVTGSMNPVITSLVKATTGLEVVSAESFLKQTAEILSNEPDLSSQEYSHPENYIRAFAVDQWARKGAASMEEIEKLIEGKIRMNSLDIFEQVLLEGITEKFLMTVFQPDWMRSSLYLSHAKMFKVGFAFSEEKLSEGHAFDYNDLDLSVQEYLCYVLFDFNKLDRSGEQVIPGWIFALSATLRIQDVYDRIYKKENKFSDKQMGQAKEKCLSAYDQVLRSKRTKTEA